MYSRIHQNGRYNKWSSCFDADIKPQWTESSSPREDRKKNERSSKIKYKNRRRVNANKKLFVIQTKLNSISNFGFSLSFLLQTRKTLEQCCPVFSSTGILIGELTNEWNGFFFEHQEKVRSSSNFEPPASRNLSSSFERIFDENYEFRISSVLYFVRPNSEIEKYEAFLLFFLFKAILVCDYDFLEQITQIELIFKRRVQKLTRVHCFTSNSVLFGEFSSVWALHSPEQTNFLYSWQLFSFKETC